MFTPEHKDLKLSSQIIAEMFNDEEGYCFLGLINNESYDSSFHGKKAHNIKSSSILNSYTWKE